MSLIYTIQCVPTGLLYVGMTRQQLNQRVRMHRYNAKKPTKLNKLYLSIQEHGWDNHRVSVVEEVTDDTLLKERECYYIDKWDTLNNGLNSVPGGGVYPHLPGELHPLWGKGHSKEARQKISDNHADVSGAKNGRARSVRIHFANGDTLVHPCLKVWCKDNGYSLPAHANRVVGKVGSYHKKPTCPHPASGVIRIEQI
jgi:group I intron endonuclease